MSSVAMTLSGSAAGQPSSAADFPANRTALQENVKLLVMTVISGRNCGESFGRLNPDGSLLKMSQGYAQANLEGFLEASFMTFPKWGTLSDGVLGRLLISERLTIGNGSLLWPTPNTPREHDSDETAGKFYESQTQMSLAKAVHLWPTPTSRDHKDVGNLGSWGGENEGRHSWQTWSGREPLSGIWQSEPKMGRVANGVPRRVDRLRCLGNAVVPQQVYPILKAIAEIERGRIVARSPVQHSRQQENSIAAGGA